MISENFVGGNYFDLLYRKKADAPDNIKGHYCFINDLETETMDYSSYIKKRNVLTLEQFCLSGKLLSP